MNSYDIAVFLHVVCVVLWVGGGLGQLLGGEMARRKRGPDTVLAVVDVVSLLGPIVFVPVSFLTLVTGATAAWMGPGFTDLWIQLGLVGYAVTFLTGLLIIKPRAEQITALVASGTVPKEALAAKAINLMTIARFDHVILFLVIALMVLKPTPDDTILLAGMATLLVLGALATIVKGLRANPVPA